MCKPNKALVYNTSDTGKAMTKLQLANINVLFNSEIKSRKPGGDYNLNQRAQV